MTGKITQSNKNSKSNKSSNNRKVIYRCIGIFSPILLVYIFLSFYYNTHFFTNTSINGVSASNMTAKEVEEAIGAEVKSYELILDGRKGTTDSIYGETIGLHTVFDGSIGTLLKKQNGLTWPVSLFKNHKLNIKTVLNYDEDLLKEQFDKLSCFKKDMIIKPVNATISEYGENGFEIIPESPGTKVNKKKLYEAVKKSILSLEPYLNLEEEGCYVEPKIKADSDQLQDALKKLNKIAGSRITYQFGDVTEVLDGTKIGKWLSVDKDLNVIIDPAGVKEFVDYIGKTYNSFGRTRTFKTSYGDVVQVKGGDYGWWLDRSTEASEITELIKKGKKVKKDPTYFQTAQQYGEDDIGNTYVEVNLTAQHLFFYKDGSLILESDFVSGNVSRNFGTPTGTYPVQYKEKDATLNGEDYSTPVKYWMPFYGNVGFHDASWRNKFGSNIYLTRGSHGCINMPPANAKKMYENINRGVAVIVYELKGTESYKKDKDKKKDKEDSKEYIEMDNEE